jgi:hypothetical protein
MRFYKLRVTPDAAIKAATFNEQLKPELIPEQNDPFCVDWIHNVAAEPYYVGEKVRLAHSWLSLNEGSLTLRLPGTKARRPRKAGIHREMADLGFQIQHARLPVKCHDY